MDRTFDFKSIINLGLVFLLFSLPLFFTIWNTSFVPVKDFFAQIILLVLGALWLIYIIEKNDYKFLRNPLTLPILIFGLIVATSLVHTVSLYDSFRGLARWGSYILLYLMIVSNVKKRSQVRWLLGATLAAGSLAAIYAIFQFYGIDFPFWLKRGGRGRLFSTFGNPNYLAGYLIACIPIAFIWFISLRNRIKRFLAEFVIVILYTAVLMTYTRASWAALLVASFFILGLLYFYLGRKFFSHHRSWLIGLASILLVIAIIYSTPNPINWEGKSVAGRAASSFDFQQGSLQKRFLIWFSTIQMAKWHPIIGSGIGTLGVGYPKAQGEVLAKKAYKGFTPLANKSINTHNDYLHLWAEIGILGILSAAWIVILFYKRGLVFLSKAEKKDKFLLIGCLGATLAILGHAFLSFPFHIIQNGLVFWLALSLGTVMIKQEGGSPGKQVKSSGGAVKGNSILTLLVKRFIQIAIIAIAVMAGIFIVKVYLGDAYAGRGRIFAMGENYKKAASELEKAAKIDPHNGKIYRFLGPIYSELGDYEKAIDALKKAAINWKFPPMYSLLGSAYLNMGQFRKARETLQKGIYLFPHWASTYYNLGNLYVREAKNYLKEEKLIQAERKLDEAYYWYEQSNVFDKDQGFSLRLIKAYHRLGLKIEAKDGKLEEVKPSHPFFSKNTQPILSLVPAFGQSGQPVYLKAFYWDPKEVKNDLTASIKIASGANLKTLKINRLRKVSDKAIILGVLWKPSKGKYQLRAQVVNRGSKTTSESKLAIIVEKGQSQCEITDLKTLGVEKGIEVKMKVKNWSIEPLQISGRVQIEDLKGKLVAQKQTEVGFETIPPYGTIEVEIIVGKELLPKVYRAKASIIYGGNKITTFERLFTPKKG